MTWLFSLVVDALGLFTRQLFEGPHPATPSIWQPDAFSLGVAISVSTISAYSQYNEAWGSFVQVVVNSVGIVVAGTLTLRLPRSRAR